ncbi:restriction endonuclease subunit S [Halobacteriota archaeon]
MNEGRPGYKGTKIGWIPEEWETINLFDAIRKIKRGPSLAVNNNKIGIRYLTSDNVLNIGVIDWTTVKHLDKKPSELNSIIELQDLILNCVNSKAQIGKVAYVSDIPETTTVGFNNFALQIDQSIFIPKFLSLFLQSKRGSWQIKRVVKPAINQASFSSKDLKFIYAVRPKLTEQKKIAQILSTWYTAIQKTEALIKVKQEQKKGLIQQLLTGKKRFSGFEDEWDVLALENFLMPTLRPIDKPNTPYYALGIRSHCKGSFRRYVEDPNGIFMDTLYKVKNNDFIVNITFAWEGAVAVIKEADEGCLVSHRFPTYTFDENKSLPDFFKQVILQDYFIYKLGTISPGGAGRNRVLSKKDLLKIKLQMPSIEEQQKIASVLYSSDNNIALLQQQLNELKLQKKGLMQQLITGSIRVKVDNRKKVSA